MSEQLCVNWNNYATSMANGFKHLFVNKLMVDVTIVCDTMILKAHKIVLATCSPLFRTLLSENPCQHPIVILKDVKYADMKAILDLIYSGKVNIAENQLSALKKTAEILKMRGIVAATTEHLNELLPIPSVAKQDDEPPSKRRKRRSRKSSSDQSEARASQSGNPDSDIEEVFSSGIPLVVGANETFPPDENLKVVEVRELVENNLQIPMQEDSYSVQSNTEQQREPQNSNSIAITSISVGSKASEIVSPQPECSAVNVKEQDYLMLKEAVETLKVKGLLLSPVDEKESADKEGRSSPDLEIVPDSDIEEITPDDDSQQEHIVHLDDHEFIVTDIVPSSSDSSHPPEMSSVSRNEPEDEPPSKRRKRKRRKVSTSNGSTRNSHSTETLHEYSCQSQQQRPEMQSVVIFAPKEKYDLQPNKLSGRTLTRDVPNEANKSPVIWQQTGPNSTSFIPLSLTEVSNEHPESTSGQLVIEGQLSALDENFQMELTEASTELDGQNDDGVLDGESRKSAGQLVIGGQLSALDENFQMELSEVSSELDDQNDVIVPDDESRQSGLLVSQDQLLPVMAEGEIDDQNNNGVSEARKSDSATEK